MDSTVETLRAEIELLQKQVARLEASLDTWKKLATAWEWLAENKD
jgi:uncharacterized small protein (DUF1192 family)